MARTEGPGRPPGGRIEREVEVPIDGVRLAGTLTLPEDALGVVLFAHGAGSSRFSPRNRFVASELVGAGVGTLLFDLLTEAESDDREKVFDIPLLAGRLIGATEWVRADPESAALPIGYFGASTGAAAALVSAARRPQVTFAVVSRGGRPDLARTALAQVRAPTLLIVGERDERVIDMNREAMRYLRAETRLEIVPGATHLFEEPGALDVVTRLAADWFLYHLRQPPVEAPEEPERPAPRRARG